MTKADLLYVQAVAHAAVMLDVVLVVACVAVVTSLVLFVGEEYSRLKVQESWRHHSAFYGDQIDRAS